MKKVLVIDDEKAVRVALVSALQAAGYATRATGTGAEGLTLALMDQPSLILCDINMAGMNGPELLNRLRAHPETSAIPVILMTGQALEAGARTSMNLGADDHLQKPFSMEQLLVAVRARLQRQAGIHLAGEAERTLAAEQLQLLTSALESAANGILITDRTGKIEWANRALCQLTGHAFAEIVGQNPRIFKSGRQNGEFYANMWQVVLAGQVWQGELANRRKDGTCYDEEMTITPVRGRNGEIENFIAIKQDVSERKRSEQILRESEARFHSLFENMSEGFACCQMLFVGNRPDDFVYLEVNPAFERLTGLKNVCGKKVSEVIPGIHQANPELLEIYGRVSLTGKPERFENYVGPLKTWFSISVYSQQLGHFIAVLDNVTARKQTEQALAHERDLLQTLMNNLPDHIYFKDTGSRFLRINRALAGHLGLQHPDESTGKTDADYFPESLARQKLADEQLLLASGKPLLGLVEKSDTARGEKWVSSIKVPTHGVDGQIDGLVGISHDITQRKQAEEELERRTALLEAQLNCSIDGILVVDEKGKKILQNQRLVDLFKVPRAIVDDPDDEKLLDWVTQAAKDSEKFLTRVRYLYSWPHETGQDEIELKNGTILDRYSAPMTGPGGKHYGRVWIFRDITERKRAESERQRMEMQLRQSQKLESIGQLAAGIAHEINTPTQYVGDNTRFVKDSFEAIVKVLECHEELFAAATQNAITPELLARNGEILAASDLKYIYKQIPSALEQTLEGVGRVAKIVRAMKEFSHPGSKEKVPADLNKAIESTATVANNEWKYVADLKLELEPKLPFVPCFLGEFNQCILNLIVNAAHSIGDVIKAKPGTKGLITVQTRANGDQVEVRVTDTGTGIPEAARPKIFEPFFTTKGVGKGTGQGLAMIYGSIVNRHGGTVTFETETGRGTTFIIHLPLKPRAESKKPSYRDSTPDKRLIIMNSKILFIDDDTNLLEAVERNLRLKFNLVTAASGEAGLAKMANEGPFSVVVADMQMPGMNGVQVLTEAQKRFPDTVRLMLTGNADQQTAVEAVNKGHVFQFLTKPCPTEMLTFALQTSLKQYRLITAERELLEKTLNGSVKLLTEVFSLIDPHSFGRGESLRSYMRAYVSSLTLANSWEFEIAAMLSQLGTVTVPPTILEKYRAGQELTEMEKEIIARIPKAGADLLANIPRLETIARAVLYQQKHYDGSGFPANVVHGEDIPIGARILKVLIDLLELEAQKMTKDAALAQMQQRMGWYDPRVLDATFACFDIYLPDSSVKSQGHAIAVKDLQVGQVTLTDIRTESGKTLVMARSRLTPVLLMRLANFAKISPIREPVYIESQARAKTV